MAEKKSKGKKVAEGKKVTADLKEKAKALYKAAGGTKNKAAKEAFDELIEIIEGMPERISMRAKRNLGEKKEGGSRPGGLTIPSRVSHALLEFFEHNYPEFLITREVDEKDTENKDKIYREEDGKILEVLPIMSWSLVTSLLYHHADQKELKEEGVWKLDEDPELKAIFVAAIAKYNKQKGKDEAKITLKTLNTPSIQKLLKFNITSLKKPDREKFMKEEGLDGEKIQEQLNEYLAAAKDLTKQRTEKVKAAKEEKKAAKKKESERKKAAKEKGKKTKKEEPKEEEEEEEAGEEEAEEPKAEEEASGGEEEEAGEGDE